MAPEIHSSEEFTGKLCDIFSLGVVLFTMYFCAEPWSSTKTTSTNKYFMSYKEKRINLFLNQRDPARHYRNK